MAFGRITQQIRIEIGPTALHELTSRAKRVPPVFDAKPPAHRNFLIRLESVLGFADGMALADSGCDRHSLINGQSLDNKRTQPSGKRGPELFHSQSSGRGQS